MIAYSSAKSKIFSNACSILINHLFHEEFVFEQISFPGSTDRCRCSPSPTPLIILYSLYFRSLPARESTAEAMIYAESTACLLIWQ